MIVDDVWISLLTDGFEETVYFMLRELEWIRHLK